MKKTRRVRRLPRTKTVGATGSRSGRLLAFLSMLITPDRGRRRRVATYLPPRAAHPASPRYPVSGGHDVGSLLR